MRVGRLPLLVSLFLALATGIVPLRECLPTDGCAGGVVLVGTHGHDHGHSDDGDAPDAPPCVDSPLTLARPAAAVSLPTAAAAPALLEVVPAAPEAPLLATTRDARVPHDADVPRGTRGVVLLR